MLKHTGIMRIKNLFTILNRNMAKIYFHLYFAATFFLNFSFLTRAQVSTGGLPFTFTQNFTIAKSAVPEKLMPAVDNSAISSRMPRIPKIPVMG